MVTQSKLQIWSEFQVETACWLFLNITSRLSMVNTSSLFAKSKILYQLMVLYFTFHSHFPIIKTTETINQSVE